jgi:hypothetical protein
MRGIAGTCGTGSGGVGTGHTRSPDGGSPGVGTGEGSSGMSGSGRVGGGTIGSGESYMVAPSSVPVERGRRAIGAVPRVVLRQTVLLARTERHEQV